MTNMAIDGGNQQLVADTVPFARSYQLEALEMALKQNTIVYMETGTGKTLIAIMLLRSYAHLLRKPSPYVAVFLVPSVVLVSQQCDAVVMLTDLKAFGYYGHSGTDFWDATTWNHEIDKHEVLVMTPQILLNALRHRFMRLNQIKVLIFDECHHARGKHPYVCIMTEFYHQRLKNNSQALPRIFGMTASPIKAKAPATDTDCSNQISALEDLMHSKFFTYDSDSVLTRYTPSSTPKLKTYDHNDIPHDTSKIIENNLLKLVKERELSLGRLDISQSVNRSAKEKLKKLMTAFMFCLAELGVWLAMKAAEVYSQAAGDIFLRGNAHVTGNRVAIAFSKDAVKAFSSHIPSDPQWSLRNDLKASMDAGYVSSKVICLVETLLEYRELKDLRCIVFVQRVVSAIVISELLNELLQESTGWRTEYTGGSGSSFRSQSREEQHKIVENFRKGTVNIIIATSMLEEGLDVQSCNLVIRFDLSATICSFIQSRGRARMQNSDFVIMVKSDDHLANAKVKKYLESGSMMQKECLSRLYLPCQPLSTEIYGEPQYQVECTGAIVTLSSSVALLNFYCSRLPSDRYFKPYPRCTIDKELGRCTLYLPSSCPIQTITISDKNTRSLKQLACLEACKKLHQVGALTDNLVPDIVGEEAEDLNYGSEPYLDEHVKYIPRELVGTHGNKSETRYECCLIELRLNFQYDEKPRDILLAVHERLDNDLENFNFDLNVDRGKVTVNVKGVGYITLNPEQVAVCEQFQVTLFGILLKHELDQLHKDGLTMYNYLLLPVLCSNDEISIDWKCICAVLYPNFFLGEHTDSCSSRGGGYRVHTKNGLVCCCMLENALVRTPHNGRIYCTKGILDGIDGNSCFNPKDGESITYKDYFKKSHGIRLQFERQNLLHGKHIFTVQNYLKRCRAPNREERSNSSCELPLELCSIIMSPISISTIYSFSLLPSVMHRIESLLIAANLKSVPLLHSNQNAVIPTVQVLEAITTNKCQEKLHLESMQTLGDSFLKYAASQQLFKTYQNRHEGLLSLKRERTICNAALCKLGCDRRIPGFIRNEEFDVKTWIIPGINCGYDVLKEEQVSWCKKVYIGARRNIKGKIVADVVKALLGAYLIAGGEKAALSFMVWLGITVDFVNVPYMRTYTLKPDAYINVTYLESLLNYKFRDACLLVEALTHGSYMFPEIPICYQRLEFLGDAVLDYLMTLYLYFKYNGLSPELLTDLRSASVNNDCYARSAIRAGLYKHILHLSPDLHRHICATVSNVDESLSVETFGWESEMSLPKVLGDVIESIAGAIYVDSGCDKERVFDSMRPLLEPLVTVETLRLHPRRELDQLCRKMHYDFDKPVVSRENGMAYVTVEVEAQGVVHRASRSASDKKTAERLACRDVLKSLKERMSEQVN
ncbi:hypothetical protein ACS0TY_018436 [Phlomoides rotata]